MKERYNLTWSQDGEILTWREHEYFIFDEAASAESDTNRSITSLNMPFMAMRANLAGPTATEIVSTRARSEARSPLLSLLFVRSCHAATHYSNLTANTDPLIIM
jgi:hypothetical protein